MKKLVGLLVAATAACGNDGVHHLPDGPPQPIDAASNIDAPIQPVTLTIMSDGVAQANVPVYFQGSDSSTIATTTTDASGVATALMPHGGYVTAIDPFPTPAGSAAAFATTSGNHNLRTFADVKPGDHLKLDNSTVGSTPTNVTINLPIDNATTNQYYVYNSCDGGYTSISAAGGSGVTPTTTTSLYGCGATADFLVVSLDTNYKPLNYFLATDVAVTNAGTVDLTTGHPYVGATLTTFDVNNIATFLVNGGYYYLLYGTTKGMFRTNYGGSTPLGGTGNQVAMINKLGGTGSFMAEWLQLYGNYSEHDLYRWGATPAGDGSYTLDAASTLLDFNTIPSYDQPSASVVWTTRAGTKPDAYYSSLYFTRSADSLYWNWEMSGAYSGLGSVHFPTLPGDAAAFNVAATDTSSVQDTAVMKVPGSWDAVRPIVFDLFDQGDPTDLVVGAAGQFEIEWGYNNVGLIRARTPRHTKRH